jgi:hypothetical protein
MDFQGKNSLFQVLVKASKYEPKQMFILEFLEAIGNLRLYCIGHENKGQHSGQKLRFTHEERIFAR